MIIEKPVRRIGVLLPIVPFKNSVLTRIADRAHDAR
jgi:hypothetical protein